MTVSHSRPPALKRYGQNHLVDPGTLEAILAMARVGPDDVVLEVGSAGGLLTARLVTQARVVHAFEIDRRFSAQLEGLAGAHDNLHLCFADALRFRLGDLDPAPTALVSNLAYNIAIPLIMKTIPALPTLRRWAVMVQRELAERLFAQPRTKSYAAVSVLVQLVCVRDALRPVSRTVFAPPPNVDSAFVTFDRRGDWPTDRWRAIDSLARIAFSQRRKMLTNSLSGAAHAGRALTRDDVRRALDALGLPATSRPEELAPSLFVDLARELGWS